MVPVSSTGRRRCGVWNNDRNISTRCFHYCAAYFCDRIGKKMHEYIEVLLYKYDAKTFMLVANASFYTYHCASTTVISRQSNTFSREFIDILLSKNIEVANRSTSILTMFEVLQLTHDRWLKCKFLVRSGRMQCTYTLIFST